MVLAIVALAGGTRLAAQKRAELELGTQAGITFLHSNGTTTTNFSLPGGGVLGSPTIYLAIFPDRRLSIEPQLAFTHSDVEDASASAFAGVLRLAGYLEDARASPYLFGDLGVQTVSAKLGDVSNSTTRVGAGFGIGYRARFAHYLVVRPEAEFREWTEHGPSEIVLRAAFGVVLPNGR
jgi:hypothetical protein